MTPLASSRLEYKVAFTTEFVKHRHLRIDNTDLSPEQVAVRVLAWLDA